MGATGIEPMTSTVSSTVDPRLDKGFSDLECAGVRKIPQENCNSAPWAHPIASIYSPECDLWVMSANSAAPVPYPHQEDPNNDNGFGIWFSAGLGR
jgi:hypothetical protein